MKLFFLVLGFLPMVSFALEPLHCEFDGKSKRYIQNDFNAGYPRDIIFQCGYRCRALNLDQLTLIGTHRVSLRNQRDEAYATTCSGVKVKKTKWGYDYDGTESFYAHTSRLDEIKNWAREQGRDEETENRLRGELIHGLAPVIQGYTLAGQTGTSSSPAFAGAALLLQQAQEDLVRGHFEIFDSLLIEPSKEQRLSSQGLAHGVAKSLGYWRL